MPSYFPFILREAGLYVSDTPKIQSPEPDKDTHVIFDHETRMRVHLGLNGIFSYFNCRAISADEMKDWRKHKVIKSTPLGARWDPYNPVYQEEEDAMLDGRGKVLQKTPDRTARFDLIERDHWEREMGLQSCYCEPMSVHEYEGLIAKNFSDVSAMVGSEDVVDARFLDVMDDELKRGVSTVESCLLDDELADAMEMESLEIKTSDGISAGSLPADATGDDLSYDSLEAMMNTAAATLSTLASNPKGFTADWLPKIWRISQEEAEFTLAREVGTVDRALQYQRYIDTVFDTDTLHVTGEAKSTRGLSMLRFRVCQSFSYPRSFHDGSQPGSVQGGSSQLLQRSWCVYYACV